MIKILASLLFVAFARIYANELEIETLIEAEEDCDLKAAVGDTVSILHEGFIISEDGERSKFDSNVNNEPLTFVVGENKILKGMEQGVQGMCEGLSTLEACCLGTCDVHMLNFF